MSGNTSFHNVQEEALVAKEILKKINCEEPYFENELTYGPSGIDGLYSKESCLRALRGGLQSLENSVYQNESAFIPETWGWRAYDLATNTLKESVTKLVSVFISKENKKTPHDTFSIPDEPEGMYSKEKIDEDICLTDALDIRLKAPKKERKKIKVKVRRIGSMSPRIKIDDEWAEWL